MYGPICTPVGADDSGLMACEPAMEKLRPERRAADSDFRMMPRAACFVVSSCMQWSHPRVLAFQRPHEEHFSIACRLSMLGPADRRCGKLCASSACARTVDLSHSSHAPSLRTHSPHPLHLSLVCATGLDCGRCGVPACMYGPICTPVGADDSGLSACVPAMEKLRPDLRSAEAARLCCAPAACSLLGRFEQCSQSDLRSFQQPHDVQRTLVWSMACDGMT